MLTNNITRIDNLLRVLRRVDVHAYEAYLTQDGRPNEDDLRATDEAVHDLEEWLLRAFRETYECNQEGGD